jgi:hypothetical protein
MMKKNEKVIAISIIVLLALSFASCLDQDESSEKKKLERAKSTYLVETISKSGSDEFISLLSIKYDLNSELTHKIINEFIREDSLQNFLSISEAETVEELERLKTKFDRPSVEERIRKISTETNIEQSTVASLLIDYKIWYESQNSE